MIALVVSRDSAFTPKRPPETNKAVIMIQSGIHAGEIEGKDTVLMLVRDMTVTQAIGRVARQGDLRDHAGLQRRRPRGFQPLSPAQPERAEITGLRATAQRLNLNRDYIKADTPEMRAWLRLFNAWRPDFLIDNHVTDGSDMQYDVTWDMARNQDIAEPARRLGA